MTDGRYMYCIINNDTPSNLGNIGINDAEVYTIPYQNIAAVVHSCEPKPYETKDNKKAKEWILAHGYVIDHATKNFGTVLPFSFNAIIRGGDSIVKNWLAGNHDKFKGELERVKNMAEYSVQVFYEHEKLAEKIEANDKELGELKAKMGIMPKGTAYLVQKQYEQKVKDAISVKISKLTKELGSRIIEHAEEMRIDEKTSHMPEKYKDKKLILAVACLVHKNKVETLGKVLDCINGNDDFAVRFTGPWAPFSFVKLREV